MKTKKFFMSLFMAVVAMGGFSACSDDEPNNNQGQNGQNGADGEGVYMSLTVKMPSADGSRSTTVTPGQSNDGTEVGTKEENNVSNVLIVLAKSDDNSFIVAGEVMKDGLTAIPTANSYKTVVKMQKTNLNNYYAKQGFSRYVNIFVFCNPTQELKDAIDACDLGNTDWYNTVCNVKQKGNGSEATDVTAVNNGIWSDNNFLMSNVTIDTRALPATINDWDAYKTINTAFDFSGVNQAGQDTEVDNSTTAGRGPVKVLRAVARFDFKDGSNQAADWTEGMKANTYNVVRDKDGYTLVQVELNRMSLANMSNKFYYLPRVSDNGTPSGTNFALCGAETEENYLVGPYWSEFATGVSNNFDTYFNFAFFNSTGTDYNRNNWYTSRIVDVLGGKGDLYEGPDHNGNAHTPGTYKVWRYATPNLIPGGTENQKNGITTAVIFEGRMIATEACNGTADHPVDEYVQMMYDYMNGKNGKSLTGNPSLDPILYSFSGSLYFTWNNVVAAAIAASVTFDDKATDEEGKPLGYTVITNVNRSEPLYVAVFGNGGMGTFTYDGETFVDPDDATLKPSETSANALWNKWQANKTSENELAMRNAIVGQGFGIYQSSTVGGVAGYYCFYFYWNRHNDNLQNGVMGPMEFAVVRNNVYKLAVTGIKQLGHPRLPGNDPDSPTPGTPDESDDVYLTVTCDVVPWVVRLNNIEF